MLEAASTSSLCCPSGTHRHVCRNMNPPAARVPYLRKPRGLKICAASVFDEVEQQMQYMDRRLFQLDREMQRQMERMDRDIDTMLRDARVAQRDIEEEAARIERGWRTELGPNVRVEKQEEVAPGRYRYYESIQISSYGPMVQVVPAMTSSGFSPFLATLLLATAVYSGVAIMFNHKYDLTTYSEESRWKLLFLWPFLVLFNKSFRSQFLSALRGVQVKRREKEES